MVEDASLPAPQVITWHGKPIADCSRDELLEGIAELVYQLEQERTFARSEREMFLAFDAARRKIPCRTSPTISATR